MLDKIAFIADYSDSIINFIPTVLYIAVILLWVGLIRRKKWKFTVSLKISLVLLLVSIVFTVIGLKFKIDLLNPFVFIFLVIAVIQKNISK